MKASDLISEASGISHDNITNLSKLGDPVEWDSLAQLMIVSSLEDFLSRDLEIDEFERAKTYEGINEILDNGRNN
tara:strand:+ start:227 stop:451 length:225 start_codon:yes stop_codon:yes gene_type:complete